MRVDADEKWLAKAGLHAFGTEEVSRPLWIWQVSRAVDQEERAPVDSDVATISESLQQPPDVIYHVVTVETDCAISTSFSSPSQRRDHDSLAHARQRGSPARRTAIHR